MKALLAAGAAAAGVMLVPVISVLALIGVSGAALACSGATLVTADAALAASAPVPQSARAWIALTHAACPALPTPWIAAVMDQESGFRPDAYAADSNGGTWGLFQLNATVWRAAYGAAWDADLNHDGVPDIRDPEIHASTAGRYLCQRLDGVRALRAAHPDWPATIQLSDLDDLVIAHNAGEGWLPRYPDLPGVTGEYVRTVHGRATAWTATPGNTVLASASATSAATSTATSSGSPTTTLSSTAPTPDEGCPAPISSGTASPSPTAPTGGVVAGESAQVAAAVRRAYDLAGARTGWLHWCDKLVCRAYGYANSGYPSAADHWRAMLSSSQAHPRDRCPPTGSFLFWTTNGPLGHAALVVHADPGCDVTKTLVLSNMVLDPQNHTSGGAYIVTLAQIESGFVTRAAYLGWSVPVCAGQRLSP